MHTRMAFALALLASAACAPITEVTRRGESAPPLAATTAVVLAGDLLPGPKKTLLEGAQEVCAGAPESVRTALAEDDSHINILEAVSVGRFRFVGDIVVRRPKNDRAALDMSKALEAGTAQARALGANVLTILSKKEVGQKGDESSITLAEIGLVAYRVDCSP